MPQGATGVKGEWRSYWSGSRRRQRMHQGSAQQSVGQRSDESPELGSAKGHAE